MADRKVSELTSLAAPALTDLVYVVHDPSGTPVPRQSTVAQLLGTSVGLQGPSAASAPALYVDNQAGTVDGSPTVFGNLGLGTDTFSALTPGSYPPGALHNTAFGYQAMKSATTASEDAAFGYQALYSQTSGIQNTAIGSGVLRAITTGSNATGVGFNALYQSTASNSTAVGYAAMYLNTTGTGNTAVGSLALYTNTTGTNNTAMGYSALTTTTGARNSGFGTNALKLLTTGTDNTAVGSDCYSAATTGAYNVAIGANAALVATTGNQNVIIGAQAAWAAGGVVGNATVAASASVIIGMNSGAANNTDPGSLVAIGYQAVAANCGTALGFSASAGGAGSVAIGCDNGGTGATTSTANEIKLGTALHTTNIIGSAQIGGAAKSLGFYGTAPIAKQTGVAVTAAGIHAACVALGLFAA